MAKKILIIDDEELITRTLANALEKAGYDILVAKSGSDAVVMAEEEDFDLIISDIRMPGMNGVEAVKAVLEAIKKKGLARIPTIFVTGYADEKVEAQAKLLHPMAYITKPFDYPFFLKKVEEAIGFGVRER